MRKFFVAAATLAGLALAYPTLGLAQVGKWVVLGQHSVKIIKPEHDVVSVGNTQGFFTHIDLKVAKNSVHFYDVKVIYGNNEEDHLQVRKLVPAGGATGPLELNREKYRQRVIKEIHLTYQSGKWFKGRAEVQILGKHGA